MHTQSDSVVAEGKRKILVALQLMKKLNRLSHLHCKEQKDITQKVCAVLKYSGAVCVWRGVCDVGGCMVWDVLTCQLATCWRASVACRSVCRSSLRLMTSIYNCRT